MVEEQQNSGEMHQGSSHPQSQSSNSQAASSHQPSSAGNNASSNASTSYRVSRIAYADTDTCADELTLDLGGLSDFGKLSIRAVCDESLSSQVVVELFSLAVMMTVMSMILAVHCRTRTSMMHMTAIGVHTVCRAVIFPSMTVLRWECSVFEMTGRGNLHVLGVRIFRHVELMAHNSSMFAL